MAGAKLF